MRIRIHIEATVLLERSSIRHGWQACQSKVVTPFWQIDRGGVTQPLCILSSHFPGGTMNTEMNARPGAIEGKDGVLVKDIKSVVGSADTLMKDMASATTQGYAAARTRVEGKLIEARSRLDDARLAVAQNPGTPRESPMCM
jgi:hypothetical protein